MDRPTEALMEESGRKRPAREGFNFTWHMRRLCTDLTSRLSELDHIDLSRVGIRFCQARKAVRHGVHASLTPLRFAGGALSVKRGKDHWRIERLYDADGRELLYLLSFYLPRFCEHSYEEKLGTVIHELWHISPQFDGDLRRHPGRCFAHSHSRRQYDDLMGELARKWLRLDPPDPASEFLKFNFRELEGRYGRVFGQRIATPKLVRAS